jgi:protein O-GlcNAc transferase
VWSRILRAVPNSRLLLKAKQLNFYKNYYLQLFRKKGIEDDRIKLSSQLFNEDDHLLLYNSIDICLDPFPFNGATTTCEALWMGTPVITLSGNCHAGRVGASILSNVGLGRFIANDLHSYIGTAAKVASEPDYLKYLRDNLRDQMKCSLCVMGNHLRERLRTYIKLYGLSM